MAENSLLFAAAGAGAGALTIDYFINGPRSIIGKILGGGHWRHKFEHRPNFPIDPYYGRPKFGETSTGVDHDRPEWVYPVKTARAPFPDVTPDMSGRVKIPIRDGRVSRRMAEEVAAEQVANLVFTDVSFLSHSTERNEVGDSVSIRNNLLHLIKSPDAPELLLRLVEFHHKHGPEALNRGSPLYKQSIQLAGSCADMYESYIGVEKWFSREGNAYAAEYDSENDRLAAAGAKSPIQFNIGGAYWNQ